MVAWSDDVKLPERDGNGAQGEPATRRSVVLPPMSEHQSRSESFPVRRAAPDTHGLGPVWQRRHDDRDPLDDLLADIRQLEDWMRCEPSSGTGESYW